MSGPTSAYDAMLAPLIRKRDRLAEELRSIESAISALQAAKVAGGLGAPFAEQGHKEDASAVNHSDGEPAPQREQVFARMPQPQAVYEVIKRTGKALVAKSILAVLREDGSEPSGSDPVKKIQVALNRRAKSHGDIVHVGWGEWGLMEWYSAEELQKFEALIDGANARDKREHKRKMQEGIKKLQERGAHYGKAPKITPEQWELARDLIAGGATTMTSIHREVIKLTQPGENPMVFETLRRQKKALFAGEAYPARWQAFFDNKRLSSPSVESEKPGIRVVK